MALIGQNGILYQLDHPAYTCRSAECGFERKKTKGG